MEMIYNKQVHPSFREKLIGGSPPPANDTDEWVLEEEEEGDEDNDDLECPVITISKEEKVCIKKPWQQTLLIKLQGRNIGYTTLLNRINTLWSPKGAVELVALDNRFFLTKFASIDDYAFSMYGGPWVIFNHYLTIRTRCSNFDTEQDTLHKLLVWVRLP